MTHSESHIKRQVYRLRKLLHKYRQAFVLQSAVLRLADLASAVTNMKEFYPAVHALVSEHLHATNFYVAMITPERQFQVEYLADEHNAQPHQNIPSELLAQGLTGYVVKLGMPFLCDQERYQALVARGDVLRSGKLITQWMGVPLKRGEDVIGVMVLQCYDDSLHYDERDLSLFGQIAEYTVVAIDRVQRREYLESTVEQRTAALQRINDSLLFEIRERIEAEELQKALFQISELAADGADTTEFYTAIQGVLGGLMDSENCYIALVNEDQSLLAFPFYRDQYSIPAFTRPMAKGLTEYVMRRGETTLLNRQKVDALVAQGEVLPADFNSVKTTHRPTSWLGAPLNLEGKVIGVVVVQSYNEDYVYGEREKTILHFVSQHIAVAIQRRLSADQQRQHQLELERRIAESTQELRDANESLRREVEQRKKAEQRLYFEANHDALTGLANRQNFLQQLTLELAKRKRKPNGLALLFMDLDSFKEINDSHGHHVGDELLCEVSKRLQLVVRDHDLVARLGGDEFVVLLNVMENAANAEDVAQRIIDILKEPIRVAGLELTTGASIGIAHWQAQYDTPEEMMKDADAAMYQAKACGRGCFVLHKPS